MTLLSKTPHGQKWLENFDAADREVASLLIDRLMLVGSGQFSSAIIKELKEVSQKALDNNESIALFAEREVAKIDYEPKAFFPGTEKGRATGSGMQPVQVDTEKQDVGSEGLLAALLTKHSKLYPNVLSHPGPDKLRENKVRKIVIVTDFIGSGRRIYEMLDAFSRVATIQSWISYHLISFHVICYSGTEHGIHRVSNHPLRPSLSYHIACPQIEEEFERTELGDIKLLCKKYPKRDRYPLGFSASGALIAFAHGIPNNAPAILHSNTSGWTPLFQGRSTFAVDIDSAANPHDLLIERSNKVLKIRDARKCLNNRNDQLWLETMLVLTCLKKGIRSSVRLSARTQMPLSEIEHILKIATDAKWITKNNSLTAVGRSELKYSRWYQPIEKVLATRKNNFYFPTQLRGSC